MKIFLLLCALLSVPAFARTRSYSESELKNAAATFKLKDKWISPKIVKEFLPWISDSGEAMVLSLDAAQATGSNRFYGDVKMAGPDKKWPTVTAEDGEEKGESISYDYIGRLKSGMHVLVTYEYGSGTMVDTELAVFSLTPKSAKDEEGKEYRRLVLQVERLVNLGDRAVPKVTLSGNTIHVTTNFNNNRKPEEKTISF